MMNGNKPHFLFAVYMAGGNATIYRNLKSAIGAREDVDSSWLPIEMYPVDRIAKLPPFSFNGSLANSTVTRRRIRAIERTGVRFDAAFYFQHTIIMFLRGFRRRIPHVIAMDGTPLWYARHGLWYAHPHFIPGSPMARLKRAITRKVYAGAFHLLPMSHGVRDSLVHDYGIDPERITVVPPAIDLSLWNPPDRHPASRNGSSRRVLFVGADFIRKGGDVLASIAGREEFAGVEFHFVTKDFQGPKTPNVFVHAGLGANDDSLIDLYRRADLFVLPTRADSHSLASLEAMAMKLPVITSAVGGIVDIVDEGVTGHLLRPDDTEGLVARLRSLLADPARCWRMGEQGRKRVEQCFNLETNSRIIVDILRRAAASRSSAS